MKSNLLTLYRILALALLLAAATIANPAFASAGRFQFVHGDIRIVAADGRARPAQKGEEVNEGEAIISASNASAQMLMVDGGIVAIRPDTHMRIDEYKFSGQEDGSERSFFSLLKGGFRSITGLIGKLHKENYRITTPAATIGIRGTDSETIHVLPTAGLPSDVQPGTYNRVNTGATVVNGTIVGPNQVAFTPNLATPAVLLPRMPSIFEPPKAPQAPATEGPKPDKKADDKEGEAPSGDKPAQSPPPPGGIIAGENVQLPPPPPPTTALVGAASTTGDVAPAGSVYPAPFGYGGVGADISWRSVCLNPPSCSNNFTGWVGGGGSMVLEANTNRTILLNSSGFPVLIAESDQYGSMKYTAGTATLLDYGQTSIAGTTVRWGRYVGPDSFVDDQGTRDSMVMHLMWADNALSYAQAGPVLSSLGALNFTPVAAGTISDERGASYLLAGGSGLNVAAAGATITLNINTNTVAGRQWSLTYSGTLDKFYQAGTVGGMPMSLGYLNGSPITQGEASGVFIGAGANGALTSFSANAGAAGALTGTAAFMR
ncbi:hypothetical protein SCT_2450 [Sulfuricella sp. T08]|uniref:FecR family protein n=1 Tax=Sulfuricella sp. T08 TaxID=1632857 RepID=UPI0006179931|nr:FecR family protein [Sulfuricella sp. T08]GAO37035.1 hypothetical protein SCT_2450 [Sulfuricella sp. T08]